MGTSYDLNDDELFDEIERIERSKRRLAPSAPARFSQTIENFKVAMQDIKDGFSLPKGHVFKYAR